MKLYLSCANTDKNQPDEKTLQCFIVLQSQITFSRNDLFGANPCKIVTQGCNERAPKDNANPLFYHHGAINTCDYQLLSIELIGWYAVDIRIESITMRNRNKVT